MAMFNMFNSYVELPEGSVLSSQDSELFKDHVIHIPDHSMLIQHWVIPSGKHTKNYGKSPCLMGKSTINGHFQ